jgi:hypothetical protein
MTVTKPEPVAAPPMPAPGQQQEEPDAR